MSEAKQAEPGRRAMLLALVVLIALNLRPFLTAPGPVLKEIVAETGMGYGSLALLTLLPMMLMGVGAFVSPGIQAAIGTRRGIIESLNTVENSAATDAHEKRRTIRKRFEPGAASHSRQRLTILMAAKKAIHGFLGPVWSAIEPSTGESTAITRPAAAMP